jgi:ribonuclease J
MGAAQGLVLLSLYPRDVERVAEFVLAARSAGRTIVWPARVADLLHRLGVAGISTWADAGVDGVDTVTLADVRAKPGAYVVQPDPAALPELLDLPIAPGDVFLHANGEPLGEFDPRWAVFTDWLAHLGVELRRIGCWGHAGPEHLHEFVERVAPGVVFPIHTFEPTRLYPPHSIRRVVPTYDTRYGFDGEVVEG